VAFAYLANPVTASKPKAPPESTRTISPAVLLRLCQKGHCWATHDWYNIPFQNRAGQTMVPSPGIFKISGDV
jgi:hypothetical protein